jgi:hypothetical protein
MRGITFSADEGAAIKPLRWHFKQMYGNYPKEDDALTF